MESTHFILLIFLLGYLGIINYYQFYLYIEVKTCQFVKQTIIDEFEVYKKLMLVMIMI